MASGRVVTSGTQTKYVPVNSSSDSRKTKIALAVTPGIASGRVTVSTVRRAEAPMLRAASSSSGSIAANAAAAIHTAITNPWTACTRDDAGNRPVEPDHVEQAGDIEIDRRFGNACGN